MEAESGSAKAGEGEWSKLAPNTILSPRDYTYLTNIHPNIHPNIKPPQATSSHQAFCSLFSRPDTYFEGPVAGWLA
jgi:hypothetical protein